MLCESRGLYNIQELIGSFFTVAYMLSELKEYIRAKEAVSEQTCGLLTKHLQSLYNTLVKKIRSCQTDLAEAVNDCIRQDVSQKAAAVAERFPEPHDEHSQKLWREAVDGLCMELVDEVAKLNEKCFSQGKQSISDLTDDVDEMMLEACDMVEKNLTLSSSTCGISVCKGLLECWSEKDSIFELGDDASIMVKQARSAVNYLKSSGKKENARFEKDCIRILEQVDDFIRTRFDAVCSGARKAVSRILSSREGNLHGIIVIAMEVLFPRVCSGSHKGKELLAPVSRFIRTAMGAAAKDMISSSPKLDVMPTALLRVLYQGIAEKDDGPERGCVTRSMTMTTSRSGVRVKHTPVDKSLRPQGPGARVTIPCDDSSENGVRVKYTPCVRGGNPFNSLKISESEDSDEESKDSESVESKDSESRNSSDESQVPEPQRTGVIISPVIKTEDI